MVLWTTPLKLGLAATRPARRTARVAVSMEYYENRGQAVAQLLWKPPGALVFEPIAGKVIVCDSGALCTTHLDKLPYRNVPRPIFPIDREMKL